MVQKIRYQGQFGRHVSINDNGDVIAIGSLVGQAKVYKYINDDWEKDLDMQIPRTPNLDLCSILESSGTLQSDNIEVNNRLSVRNDMSTNNLDATAINTEYLGQSSGSTINVTSPNIVIGDTVITLVSSGPVSLALVSDPTTITSPINGIMV